MFICDLSRDFLLDLISYTLSRSQPCTLHFSLFWECYGLFLSSDSLYMVFLLLQMPLSFLCLSFFKTQIKTYFLKKPCQSSSGRVHGFHLFAGLTMNEISFLTKHELDCETVGTFLSPCSSLCIQFFRTKIS